MTTNFSSLRASLMSLLSLQNSSNESVDLGNGYHWLQASVNNIPTKTGAHINWVAATADELVEAWESGVRFAWWKVTPPADLSNVRMELVDAFHFMMSQSMVNSAQTLGVFNNGPDGDIPGSQLFPDDFYAVKALSASVILLAAERTFPSNSDDRLGIHELPRILSELLSVMSAGAFQDNLFQPFEMDSTVFSLFFECCQASGMDFDDLVKFYLAKNAVNTFRQANGYGKGTYIKTWTFTDGNGQVITGEDNKFVMNWMAENADDLSREEIQPNLLSWLENSYRVQCERALSQATR